MRLQVQLSGMERMMEKFRAFAEPDKMEVLDADAEGGDEIQILRAPRRHGDMQLE